MATRPRILIFQIGSLGDTVIAIPCYREIARRHPDAERLLLTNFPIGNKMVAAEALLAPCGLIDGAIEFPMEQRGARNKIGLLRKLRSLQIDELYYLMAEPSLLKLARHYGFFKACGIRTIHAVPWSRAARFPRELVPGKLWESEGSRLLRCVKPERTPGPPPLQDRSLDVNTQERNAAARLLDGVSPMERFVTVSVGGKAPIKDWGDTNWARTLKEVSAANPGLGAVFIGSADEWERNEQLAQAWGGPKLNSCGHLTPRETAAMIEKAALFIGHDTGTLHLAAAVGTRIIGIYCARNVPGKWYSDRPDDWMFYQHVPCFGCELEEAKDCPHDVLCMKNHKIEKVIDVAIEALSST